MHIVGRDGGCRKDSEREERQRTRDISAWQTFPRIAYYRKVFAIQDHVFTLFKMEHRHNNKEQNCVEICILLINL